MPEYSIKDIDELIDDMAKELQEYWQRIEDLYGPHGEKLLKHVIEVDNAKD